MELTDLPPTPSEGGGAEENNNTAFDSSLLAEFGEVRHGYNTANPFSYSIIKEFRAIQKENPTQSERKLWGYLKNKKLGYKFRRQHVIDDFIADFVCLSKKLIIEVDGKIHEFQKEYDAMRTFTLNEKGYRVIRFTNEEVQNNLQIVIDNIKMELEARSDFMKDK